MVDQLVITLPDGTRVALVGELTAQAIGEVPPIPEPPEPPAFELKADFAAVAPGPMTKEAKGKVWGGLAGTSKYADPAPSPSPWRAPTRAPRRYSSISETIRDWTEWAFQPLAKSPPAWT